MNTPSDLSTISGFRKPLSPINGVGRALGFVAMRLLENSSDDHNTIIKFVQSMALIFNCRVKWRARPSGGFYTFFVITPKEGMFAPDKVVDMKDCHCTSFKISEGTIKNPRYPGPVFYRLDNYSWNDLRSLTDGLLPETPMTLDALKNIFGRFSVETFAREGTEINGLRLIAKQVRECLENASNKMDLSGLC